MQHIFYCNDLVVKNNKVLKNRQQVAVEMEIDRSIMHQVMPLEEYDPGTHFKVTIEPLEPETYKQS
ncbi:MAG: hypothetical protein A4E53_01706 [Pelotomaculum sp. PtaB.Bin104]|nr:MAG: hypothetical protein A4E53_01706 [Pelotomaculum sp. PtaB.Bin104]